MSDLTKPQISLLRDCARKHGASCVDSYRPLTVLIESGLVELKGKYRNTYYA